MIPGDGDEAIAMALETLGSPVRLRILRQLRVPRALHQIEVPAARPDGGAKASRQTVREHLHRLQEMRFVDQQPGSGKGGAEYFVNHQTLFALSEAMRDLARWKAPVEPRTPTAPLPQSASGSRRGPRLVIVKGLEEGVAFELGADAAERAEQTIGRSRSASISLDFDPFLSAQNSVVASRDGARFVRNLETSRNGTSVNFSPLAAGAEHRLHHGDVIGVGKTLLVYWE